MGDLLPEEWLNFFILSKALAYKAMNGLGTLATVVLLGGFSTLVKQTDFWYITIIAFLQTIGYVHPFLYILLCLYESWSACAWHINFYRTPLGFRGPMVATRILQKITHVCRHSLILDSTLP